MRFILGLTQAFVVIHAPVWANEYSPPKESSRWMAMLHSAVVLGIIGGYITTSITVNYLSDYLSWRFPIYLQAICQLLCSILFLFVKKELIEISHQNIGDTLLEAGIENSGGGTSRNISKPNHLVGSYKYLLNNSIFMCVTLALCCMYFVVSGIQFWTTAYFLQVLQMNPSLVMIYFTFCSITGPLAGVSLGSYLIDLTGGYKGKNMLSAIKI
jgi:MFS family permease